MYEVCNLADESTLYSSNKEFELVLKDLGTDLSNVFGLVHH